MDSREEAVIEAFVSTATSLASGFDMVDLLTQLTVQCADLLDIASAGLLLADRRGTLHVLAASSEATRKVELFQIQRDRGPCLECFRHGVAVFVPDLQECRTDWPDFVDSATAAGFRSVHALPLRLRDTVLGALGLFGDHVGSLDRGDLRLAQALADVASVAIVQDRLAADEALVREQLESALTSRIVIEQAKGILAQKGGSDMDVAFRALRRFSRDHNQRIAEVAAALVSRSLPAEIVLRHASPADR